MIWQVFMVVVLLLLSCGKSAADFDATVMGFTGDDNPLTIGHVLKGVSATKADWVALDHDELGGLGDDDHSIYLLLNGRTGGQTAIGGDSANDDLTLRSTSNATKGDVIIQDQGGNVGIGNAAPTELLSIGTDLGGAPAGAVLTVGDTGGGAAQLVLGEDSSNFCGIAWSSAVDDCVFTTNVAASSVTTMTLDNGEVGIRTGGPVANLEVEDGGTASSMVAKITQDDVNAKGLIIGNDTDSATDTHGLSLWVDDGGIGHLQARNAGDETLALQEDGGGVSIGAATAASRPLHLHDGDGMRFTEQAAAPGTPTDGDLYADTDDNLYYRGNGAWVDLTAGGGGGSPGGASGELQWNNAASFDGMDYSWDDVNKWIESATDVKFQLDSDNNADSQALEVYDGGGNLIYQLREENAGDELEFVWSIPTAGQNIMEFLTDTADGSDNKAFRVAAGGASADTTRGANYAIFGNEFTTLNLGGDVVFDAGDGSGGDKGDLLFRVDSGTPRMALDGDGIGVSFSETNAVAFAAEASIDTDGALQFRDIGTPNVTGLTSNTEVKMYLVNNGTEQRLCFPFLDGATQRWHHIRMDTGSPGWGSTTSSTHICADGT